MKLLTKTHRMQLLANGRTMAQADISGTVKPVVKLFMPDGGATWLLAGWNRRILISLLDSAIWAWVALNSAPSP